MANLTDQERQEVTDFLMTKWSQIWDEIKIEKSDLRKFVDETDDWIGANQNDYVNSLTQPGRSELTGKQKTDGFSSVAFKRRDIPLT